MGIQARYAVGVLPLLLLAGCEDWDIDGIGNRYREDFHFSYPLNAGASVEVENSNGSVEISGWDKDTVDIDGTKYAGSEDRLRTIRVDISHSAGSISIRTFMPVGWRGSAGARYTIHVPHHVDLQSIGTSNGPVRIENIEGAVRLKTSNGTVRVAGVRGMLDARSSNGTLEIADVIGDTSLHTSNGSIRADVRKGAFEATTSNGTITARLIESDSHPVRLGSSNGRIDLTLDAVREVHADTSNSSITVRLPSSAGATVRAHTTNSSIDTDFDVSIHGGMISKHRLEGTIGSGGPLLDLGTSNGSIKILRL